MRKGATMESSSIKVGGGFGEGGRGEDDDPNGPLLILQVGIPSREK